MHFSFFHPHRRRAAGYRDLLAMQARKEVRLAHYERYFGPSFAVSAGIEEAPTVDLCIFFPNPLKGRDHYTLATEGLTDLPLAAPDGRSYPPASEILAYASGPEGQAKAARVLRALARVMADPALRLRPGVPAPAASVDAALIPPLLQVVLLPPVREWRGFETRRFTDGTEARFLWALLLSPADGRALKENRDALLARLKQDPIPYLQPD